MNRSRKIVEHHLELGHDDVAESLERRRAVDDRRLAQLLWDRLQPGQDEQEGERKAAPSLEEHDHGEGERHLDPEQFAVTLQQEVHRFGAEAIQP